MTQLYAKRRDKLRKLMQNLGLDAVLISYAANRYYLSGFELHDVQANETAGRLIISASGEDYLATDPRYTEAAAAVWPKEYVVTYTQDSAHTLARLLCKCGARIGVEMNVLTFAFFKELARSEPRLIFVSCDGLVDELRVVKDETEIAALEESFALNHALLKWLPNNLKCGQTEREIAWMIESYFREHGASELAFPSIVAINQNAAKPHAMPGDTRLTEDCLLLIDIGCRVNDYCSDQTRTIWFGDHPSKRFTETLELVKAAQSAAINMMRPGVIMRDAYAAARAVFEEHGVASAFTHGLGHGVGLETHEMPSIGPRRDDELVEGMVVTVEPGLYYPEWGGVRWEYTVIVEEDGVRQL